MELKKEEETWFIFDILDFRLQNMYKKIKIINNNFVIKSFDIQKNLIMEQIIFVSKSNQRRNIIINLFNNDNDSINFEIDIILNQINYFYLFINQKGGKLIDFIYKNYSKKETLKNIRIKFGNLEKNLNFNFIDKNEKIGRFIILNSNLLFNILNWEIGNSSNINNNNWLYCIKQYENEKKISCHIKLLYPQQNEKLNENIIENLNNLQKEVLNLLYDIKNGKINKLQFFMKLGKKNIYLKDELNNCFSYFILHNNKEKNYSKNDFINLSKFLYLKIVCLIHEKYQIIFEKIDNNKKEFKKNILNIFENCYNDLQKTLKNFDYSYIKLLENDKLNNFNKSKKLSVITSILIDNPDDPMNIDVLNEIDLYEIKKKNKNNCYVKAVELFTKIINELNYDSKLVECGLELNSKYTKNYNKCSVDKVSNEITIITLDELKQHLLKIIPKQLILINHESDNYAFYEHISKSIIMNEKYIFKDLTKNEINYICNNIDEKGIYTLLILILLFHEAFGHAKVRIEFMNTITPIKFNYNGFFISLINENKPYKEAGKIVENFLTHFNKKNQKFIYENKTIHVNCLLNYKLYIDDLSEFNRKIYDINNDNSKEVSDFAEHLKNYEKIAKKDEINFNDNDFIINYKNYLPENSEDEIDYINPMKSHFYEFLKKK